MKRIAHQHILLVIALTTALCACSKKDEAKPADLTTPEAVAPTPEETAARAPTPDAAVPPADDGADYVRAIAMHKVPKPTDPIIVAFTKFSLDTRNFDPATIEGTSAVLTLDVAGIDSGNAKRDLHLKDPDYLDFANFPQIVIKISEVKKAGEGYQAKAEVSAHGLSKELPVDFKVLKSDATSVQIEASKEFDRNDFGISAGDDDTSAATVKIEMRLTVR